jgi:hypothetical protein
MPTPQEPRQSSGLCPPLPRPVRQGACSQDDEELARIEGARSAAEAATRDGDVALSPEASRSSLPTAINGRARGTGRVAAVPRRGRDEHAARDRAQTCFARERRACRRSPSTSGRPTWPIGPLTPAPVLSQKPNLLRTRSRERSGECPVRSRQSVSVLLQRLRESNAGRDDRSQRRCLVAARRRDAIMGA